MKILGIDPGLRFTGWGIIQKEGNNISYIASDVISPTVKLSTSERLATLHTKILEVLQQYNPDCVIIEKTFVNNNNVSSLKLGEARGVVVMTPALKNIEVIEYAPNTIKKVVTGAGHANKEQVQKMVQMVLPKINLQQQKQDVSDALAIALCHAYLVRGV
ncbi:crossover junction endodeoxyribonuclease RuvC [Rickettsiales bacterium LUAb2]